MNNSGHLCVSQWRRIVKTRKKKRNELFQKEKKKLQKFPNWMSQLKNTERKKGSDWKAAAWIQLQPWERPKHHPHPKGNPCSSREKSCRVLTTGWTHRKHNVNPVLVGWWPLQKWAGGPPGQWHVTRCHLGGNQPFKTDLPWHPENRTNLGMLNLTYHTQWGKPGETGVDKQEGWMLTSQKMLAATGLAQVVECTGKFSLILKAWNICSAYSRVTLQQ